MLQMYRELSHQLAYLIFISDLKGNREKDYFCFQNRMIRLREIKRLVSGHMTKSSRAKPPGPVA